MKIKYLLTGLLASILAITSCQDPDDLVRTDNSNITGLTVKGHLVAKEELECAAVIDKNNGTIKIQVPYYISDTQEIQGDLTQMKINASLPVGAQFRPSISGIHDLVEGINTTLVYEDGTKENYKITAEYVKSSAAQILKFTLADYPRATIRIEEPETEGGIGRIVIFKTTSALDPILKNAQIQLETSPWATNSITESIDISEPKEITITSQDGKITRKYRTEISTPTYVQEGKIGFISSLFGFQPTTVNPMGFVAGENRTMAVVGDYLIIGSISNDLIVFDRYSGKKLDKVVNTTGVLGGKTFHAITSDDNDVLVGISFAAANNQWAPNRIFEVYAWENGIENAPRKVYSTDVVTNAAFDAYKTKTFDIGRTVSIKGSISGNAQIMTVASTILRVIRLKIVNGQVDGNPNLIAPPGSVSMSNVTKAIPLSTDDNTGYIYGSSNDKRITYYVNPDRTSVAFSPKGNWWPTDVKGIDYIEFNGVKLVGIQNGSTNTAHRLCVVDLSPMTPAAFATSQIMDSRLENYDSSFPGPQNSSITGMTSVYGFVPGTFTVGANANKTGDVCFGHSIDGTAVQVYLLTSDQGVIAYELTKFNMNN